MVVFAWWKHGLAEGGGKLRTRSSAADERVAAWLQKPSLG